MQIEQLSGLTVRDLTLTFGLRLLMSDESEIMIGMVATLETDKGLFSFDPDDGTWPAEKAAGVGVLLGQIVRRAVVVGGALRISFVSGLLLSVPSNDRYEPWEIGTSDRSKWVSCPGGEVGYWAKLP